MIFVVTAVIFVVTAVITCSPTWSVEHRLSKMQAFKMFSQVTEASRKTGGGTNGWMGEDPWKSHVREQLGLIGPPEGWGDDYSRMQ